MLKTTLTCVTESWLHEDGDQLVINECTPNGYSFEHFPRPSRGGGVAVIYNASVKLVSWKPLTDAVSFEAAECTFKSNDVTLKIVAVYRPPLSDANYLSVSQFLCEFGSTLESYAAYASKLVFIGDFNFHVDNVNDNRAKKLIEIVTACNLSQLVHQPTHKNGHTLDFILVNDVILSDQFMWMILDHLITLLSSLNFVSPNLPGLNGESYIAEYLLFVPINY